ncbi:uncharacterized protein Dwil_GK18062 [Drosophila willistoni]|uniref:Uncharacterized protein n=1 Tax=Drosophila willistoni TaxID=7260 RepID=B4MZE8_DROWI|nr:uncharacterized protein LOC6643478 [Drosophila willistoni]EDW77487.2 uncharacterized protein Dwil_GK18062 [Drosophila willistoni]
MDCDEVPVDLVRERLVAFDFMDNHPQSAKSYATWVLSTMDIFWRGRLINAYLANLMMPKPLLKPRECVKTLRVLHEITTYCTKVDVRRLVITTDIMVYMRDILNTHNVRHIIVRSSLTLLSNLILCGWRIRDALGESGLLTQLLKLMQQQNTMESKHKPIMGQVLWILYHYLTYKLPGPPVSDLKQIAKTLASLLSYRKDADVLVTLLKMSRLVAEYHSAMFSVMIQTELFERATRFLLSPLPEIQREALFVVANTCQMHRKQKYINLYRFRRCILNPFHILILGATMNIRILALHTLGGIIDHRCVRPHQILGMTKKIMLCTKDKDPAVRLAASWTFISLASHLESQYFPHFLKLGGLNAMCELLHQKLPVQVTRNLLSVIVLVLESYRHLKASLKIIIRETKIRPILNELQASPNVSISTLATLLDDRFMQQLCWVDVLVQMGL